MNADEIAEGFKRINEIAMKAVSAGNYAEAAAVFLEGLALEEKLGLVTQMSESHANIGNVYFSAGEYDEALPHLAKAAELFQKASKSDEVIATMLTIATILEIKGDDAGAQKQLDAVMRKARNGEQRGMVFYRIACLHQKKGDPYKAQESFSRALMEMERLNRQEDILLCLLARAALFLRTGRRELASRDVARAKSLARGKDKLTGLFQNAASELGLDQL